MSQGKPNYIIIEEQIIEDIKSKLLKPDQKLPSERLLTERFHVSRMTIRSAINNLISKGYLYREKGRGVFVQKEIISRNMSIKSFTEIMLERGMSPSNKINSMKVVLPNEIVRLSLGLDESDFVIMILRTMYADNEPMVVEYSYLPAHMFPGLEKKDIENKSLYEVLLKKYNTKIGYLKQTVSASDITETMSKELYNGKKNFALKIVGLLYDENMSPVQYGEGYYHADRYNYQNANIKKRI